MIPNENLNLDDRIEKGRSGNMSINFKVTSPQFLISLTDKVWSKIIIVISWGSVTLILKTYEKNNMMF